MTPADRRSRYQRSTGCSLTKPWPPSSWTPSEPIFIPFWAQSRRAIAASRAKSSPLVGAARRAVGGEAHAARLDPDFGDREGDALAVGDRFAERLAVVDVGDDVVEDRLRGADRERRPGDPRPVDALDVVLAPALAEDRGRRDARPLEDQPAGGGGAEAHRRLVLDREPFGARLDDEERRADALGLGGDEEELALGGAGDQRLGAVEHPVVAVAPRRRLQLQRVEQRPRLEDRQRRRGDVLAGEGGQVGRLLLGRAPEPDRGGDRAGGEGRVGDPHVAVGERLADQHAGRRRAFFHHPAELGRDAEHRDAELGRLGEDLGRRLALVVGGFGRRADLLLGERAARLLEHLLLVVGGDVEEALRFRARLARRFAQLLGGLEGAPGGGRRAEALFGALEEGPLDPFADADAVEQVGAREPVQPSQADAHRALGHALVGVDRRRITLPFPSLV